MTKKVIIVKTTNELPPLDDVSQHVNGGAAQSKYEKKKISKKPKKMQYHYRRTMRRRLKLPPRNLAQTIGKAKMNESIPEVDFETKRQLEEKVLQNRK